MNEDPHLRRLREDWTERQRELGNLPRAVLMKGMPPLVNETIDKWHRSVMHLAFSNRAARVPALPSLDVGCGYGRLVEEAMRCGLAPVVGIDFTQQFCADFRRRHGPAVCGELARLPFADAVFGAAYSVTALMYLSLEDARLALRELDRCLATGTRVLILEPSREFNSLVRTVLRRKATETLSRPGFSRSEMCDDLPPEEWQRVSAGGCRWLTALLPLLLVTSRIPALYSKLADWVLRLDRPREGWRPRGLTMYRWVVFEKVAAPRDAGSRLEEPR